MTHRMTLPAAFVAVAIALPASALPATAAGGGGAPPASGIASLVAARTALAADAASGRPAVDSTDLQGVDETGMKEPDLTAAAVDGDGDKAQEGDIAVDGTKAATKADNVIVGLTQPMDASAHDITVVGASWAAGTDPADVQVDMRELRDGRWTDWVPMSTEKAAAEPGAGTARGGTEAQVVTGASDVQARIITADGAPVREARLDVIGVNVTRTDEKVAQEQQAATAQASTRISGQGATTAAADPTSAGGSAATEALAALATSGGPVDATTLGTGTGGGGGALGTAVPVAPTLVLPAVNKVDQPTIRPRAAWGAASARSITYGTVRGAVVHHTASLNGYSQAQVPGILRGIQFFHKNSRGWADIGYNFLVDRYGTIWEGRAGGITKAVRGAHAFDYNSYSTGVSVIGNFESVTPPTAVINALGRLLAWKLAYHGVSAGAKLTYWGKTLSTISGHRDIPGNSTSCPGGKLYAKLPAIRAIAVDIQNDKPLDGGTKPDNPTVLTKLKTLRDWTGDGHADLIARTSGGTLYLYRGAAGKLTTRQTQGQGWTSRFLVTQVYGLTGAKRADIVALRTDNGTLFRYDNNGKGGYDLAKKIAGGSTSYDLIVGVQNWKGKGTTGLIARDAKTGYLYYLPGNGKGSFGARVKIGSAWNTMDMVLYAGDWDGDGYGDILAREARTKKIYLYTSDGKGYPEKRKLFADNWASLDTIVGGGDFSGDGRYDLVAREKSTGNVYLYKGDGKGRISGPRVKLATNWKSYTLVG